jgi:hypothetical protein
MLYKVAYQNSNRYANRVNVQGIVLPQKNSAEREEHSSTILVSHAWSLAFVRL